MSTMLRLAGALLLTSALTAPSVAFAQDTTSPDATETPGDATANSEPDDAGQQSVEVSVPGGGEIIVTGHATRNVEQASNQVVSVLSATEIARTGEGDIAGALGRVTGLSVVGNGFVYVRGLGDRYSLALLNGSPLPSPEPLKRVVPLDLFPTGVIASSLVQKSYSVNFPGEFGGGVINLTTKATPDETFLTISAGTSLDTITTGHAGLTYYGSSTDWTGYDNGNRDTPPALAAFFASGERMSSGTVDTTQIAREIVTGRNSVVQHFDHIPANFSGSFSAGTSFDLGTGTLGVIAGGGYSNKWSTRQPLQQSSLNAQLDQLETDFRTTVTDNRIVANGLFGLGYEFADSKIRWTNLYIHDTDKQARIGLGQRHQSAADFLQQRTGWYERQLFDSQLVGEFKLTPDLEIDARGGYANSKRKAPYELFFEYVRSNGTVDPFGQYFVNRLNNGNGGDGGATFSDLNEDLWSGGLDLSYEIATGYKVTVGGAYANTKRISTRRDFLFLAPNTYLGDANVISAIGLLRPDLLINALTATPTGNGPTTPIGVTMIETDEGNPSFAAELDNWAGYGKADLQLTDALNLDIGVRYEDATETVSPVQVFTVPGSSAATTSLKRTYWLPAATLTYEIQPGMQVRLSASKTIARPQFRELINQPYYDPETSRAYRGNPLLTDSQLYNGEARFEAYFGRDERASVAGFYKRIDHPIEAFVTGLDFLTSYANAPKAELYGGEIDLQKYFDVGDIGSGFRRFLIAGNYTYTKSKLKVGANDTVQFYGASSTIATDYFTDGVPLTGQSDHVANLQLGLENEDRLSQQTFLISYASKRVISRGLIGTPPQPDIYEKPGVQLDFVLREGFTLGGHAFEVKGEVRNILGTAHVEYQQSGANRLEVNTYDVGRTYGLTLSATL
ncbi:TonB-dependent receptor domain-containing protein [Croceibacterium aestuarii]|uniref:TonB-dependent receptor domain-containing protein n=1 Tax=Croceibacterium aestuarii TaxID=3064139 RepID=UPI00272DED35|nr:TonB-dependent receptor [Croceibacterium sp. D39]